MTEIRHHRFSIEDYQRMGETGILAPDARVELIAGEVVEMAPIGSPHASVVTRLTMRLTRRLAGRADATGDAMALVSVQNPLRIPPDSEPQPDLLVLRPRNDEYAGGHPQPQDVLLLIEVADSTVVFDRTVKVPLYARSGISEVWLVDLPGRQVFRFLEPAREGYRSVAVLGTGDALVPEALPLDPIAVADLVDL